MKDNDVNVLILMGSDSDLPIMNPAMDVLDEFGLSYRVEVTSAHRSPKRTSEVIRTAVEEGIKVIIVGAGAAAHLAGVVAAETTLPVIGVPIDSSSSPLKGIDALYSTVQMPRGVPVATMAIGSAGATNAAVLAVQILAISDDNLTEKLVDYKTKLEISVEEKSEKLKEKIKSRKR
jgi:5-(carboxyamino)imidazole ribonucleotide mutase